MSDLVVGSDGTVRCAWSDGDALYDAYHDEEWGRAVVDDHRLFEKMVLEGFQAGLAWITILRKRERFREVFAQFDPVVVADYGAGDVDRLLEDTGIIRHRGKIEAAINNAACALDLIDEYGSLARYVWPMAPEPLPAPRRLSDLPAYTEESTALSRDLKRRGWRFVGPTTMYAFMQAMGLVDDHLEGCVARPRCEEERLSALEAL